MERYFFNINKHRRNSFLTHYMIYVIVAFLMVFMSCKKMVEIPPPIGSIAENSVYTTDGSAIGVLTGIYISMNSAATTFSGNSGFAVYTGLSADELTLYKAATSIVLQKYYTNQLVQNGAAPVLTGSEFWAPLYNYIFNCNAAIAGLSNTNSLTTAVKQQLLGEAKFMRAFFYFYLVNFFGDVPLALSTDPKINTLLSRTPKAEVYQQIIADLKDAEQLLSDKYLDLTLLAATTERVRPTKWAAMALLARVYLYTGDWVNAETEATAVINNSALFELVSLNNVFLKNSKEAIWQIQPVSVGTNTWDGYTFTLNPDGPTAGPDRAFYYSPQLLNSFEPGDQRRFNRNWTDSIIISGTIYYYPYKYKQGTNNLAINSLAALSEYFMVLRLGEQFLIRSEARAQQNNINGAQADLNAIRNRAGLTNTLASDKSSLLAAILHERQVELFTEWGNRWFDLKRTGNADAVMNVVTPLKGGVWQTTDQLYPLPLTELQKAPNLVQNSGY